MNFLKQCPLLICVILVSLLIPWELLKEDDTTTTATPTAQVTTTVATEAIPTAADSMPNDVTETPSEPEESENLDDTTMPEEEPTTEAATVCVPLTDADESYFDDALFIGNSRTVGLYLFGNMPESTDFFADVGLSIYDAMEDSIEVPPQSGSYDTLQSMLSAKQYGKIYMMFGINELGTGTSESFAEYYQSVVAQICQMQPDAILYIQSIINVSDFAETDVITNSNINEKNALLENIADNQQIFYINVNESLTDSNGYLNADYTSDGIHLGGSSLPLWKDCLLSHAMQKSTATPPPAEEGADGQPEEEGGDAPNNPFYDE